ncbi:MAG: DUF1836 domain-containing protein [Clostridium celatum]|uniref:DUF1836 domain-containing protein n=1 Tax=uncultured Clostridium sp. TaxID=59620 RepID=UPI0025D7A89C|nr:DUF1836 domain-containing protein [uncultured Clostridium sp.]MDU2122718.1 DUF1836 domain-containing protein [Clostridium celatum]MDU4884467.1 DUF1836 domain-containing protein [Clostridium celatum]MDU4979374.1 DUF1836 domain-containing protein [Clostridium celatum]MDU7077636.1 DUF1836 domain-containing protein [Clostridium celatum]
MESLEFHIPRFNELPRVPLYKDQVITYLDNLVKVIDSESDEKILTPTMLNNYVKQKVVSPPKDKKYNEKHLAYLIVVCLLKQVFTLQEICELINIQIESCPIEVAYDYFCSEVEQAIKAVFSTRDFSYPIATGTITNESQILRSTVMAVANRIFIKSKLQEKKSS